MDRQIKPINMKVRFFQTLLNAGFVDNTYQFYSDCGYSEKEIADYKSMIKRAFQKGNYTVNCDYCEAWIKVGEHKSKIGFENISDKLIALVIYLASLKNANSRYKFGYYAYKVSDINDVFDAIMTSYPYANPNKVCKQSIEDARSKLQKILEEVMLFSN